MDRLRCSGIFFNILKGKETHVHFGCYFNKRCIICQNESLLKCLIFLSAHIVIHFIANRPRVCLMVIATEIEVAKDKSKPYSTIEIIDVSSVLVLDNLT